MKVDQLPIEQQESASYCHSCGEVRTNDELRTCLQCGYRLCFIDGCAGQCACTDAVAELNAEVDATIAAVAAKGSKAKGSITPGIPPQVLEPLMREIDAAIASVNSHCA